MSTVVSAPGKLMISGEYAVLEGAEAIVAAVSRRVRVWLSDDDDQGDASGPVPPEAAAARAAAERYFGSHSGHLGVDVRATRMGDQKLGVGSSAAAAAAAAGLIAARAGQDLDDPPVRRRVLEAALEGHTAVAPRGSGADVATSTLGGFVRFRRRGGNIECDSVRFPEALQVHVVWTGKQVRTSDMLDRVDALKQSNPNRYIAAMDGLRSASEAFSAAVGRGDPGRIVEAARGYHGAMRDLGRVAGADIVDDTLERIADLAATAGGAAKPSGAGGGDVALALFPNGASSAKFVAACEGEGLHVVEMALGVVGVRTE